MRSSALVALALLVIGGAAARATEPPNSSEGGWEVKHSTNPLTNTPDCILVPKQQSRVQVAEHKFIVSGLPKNSIFNFQYRIDDGAASTPARPSDAMQEAGAIYLEGPAFDTILAGKRFRIRILDRWHEAITEDVDLTGLRALHGTMSAACR